MDIFEFFIKKRRRCEACNDAELKSGRKAQEDLGELYLNYGFL